MKKAEKEYIETMAHNLNTALVMVSKGRAWIEVDEKNESIKMDGLTEEDIKQAGVIQMMFNNAIKSRQFPVEDVQKALDYFGWNLYLLRDGESVTFRGEDKFLLVQISWCMGAIGGKQYAKLYRDAIEGKERVYF